MINLICEIEFITFSKVKLYKNNNFILSFLNLKAICSSLLFYFPESNLQNKKNFTGYTNKVTNSYLHKAYRLL